MNRFRLFAAPRHALVAAVLLASSASAQDAGVRLTGNAAFSAVPGAPGLAQALRATVEVEVLTAGSYGFVAMLMRDSVQVASRSSLTSTTINGAGLDAALPGLDTLTVEFSGEEMYASGVDGPYDLVLVGGGIEGTLETPAYSHRAFGEILASAQDVRTTPVDADGDGLYEALDAYANVTVRGGGRFALWGSLLTERDEGVAYVQPPPVLLDVGEHVLSVRFRGTDIRRANAERLGVSVMLNSPDGMTGRNDPSAILTLTPADYQALLTPTERIRAAPIDTDGDGLFDVLRVEARIEISQDGPFTLIARLRAVASPRRRSVHTRVRDVTRAFSEFVFDFEGVNIRLNEIDGPYGIAVSLYDADGAQVDGVALPGRTLVYDHEQFATRPRRLSD